jgi:hypothetical protein
MLFHSNQIKINAAIGYGINTQLFYLVIHNNGNNPEPQLNSSYSANWRGFTGKIEISTLLKKMVNLDLRFRYYQLDYSADANWNLIGEFMHPVSFTHTAKGFGIENKFSISYNISKKVSLSCSETLFNYNTGKGIDELHLITGERPQTRLNELSYAGFNLNIGAEVIF